VTIHHCPKCELRFTHKTELDDHIWHDHADFRHDYPATAPPPLAAAPPPPATPRPGSPGTTRRRGSLVGWLMPKESHDHDRDHTVVAPGQADFKEREDKDAAEPPVE
jgi:hypothetical protein